MDKGSNQLQVTISVSPMKNQLMANVKRGVVFFSAATVITGAPDLRAKKVVVSPIVPVTPTPPKT